jgi:hypothetical protein
MACFLVVRDHQVTAPAALEALAAVAVSHRVDALSPDRGFSEVPDPPSLDAATLERDHLIGRRSRLPIHWGAAGLPELQHAPQHCYGWSGRPPQKQRLRIAYLLVFPDGRSTLCPACP